MLNDKEAILERYAIMTEQGDEAREPILSYLKSTSTPEAYEALLLEIDNPARPGGISTEALNAYIKAGIALHPCNQKARPLIKIKNDDGTFKRLIETPEELNEWQNKKDNDGVPVSVFAFYPRENGLIILDLDNSNIHANKANGIANFRHLIKKYKLSDTLKKCFSDFPNNFPCYVKTPHGGLHLYFKDLYCPPNYQSDMLFNSLNIEVKHKTQVTAGGSIRDGNPYILCGNISNAPIFELELILQLQKVMQAPAPTPQKKFYNKPATIANNQQTIKDNNPPEKIIQTIRNGTGQYQHHNFVLNAAGYFKWAGYSMQEAKDYILQTPEHLNRTDKADSIRTIQDIYK